eukprot:6174037-Pleurochrysis_carterae.AAC.2
MRHVAGWSVQRAIRSEKEDDARAPEREIGMHLRLPVIAFVAMDPGAFVRAFVTDSLTAPLTRPTKQRC